MENRLNSSYLAPSLVPASSNTDKLLERRDHINFVDSEAEASDSESTSSVINKKPSLFGDGLVRLEEEDRDYNFIKQRFLSGMASLGRQTSVVAIHRNFFTNFSGQARLQAFQVYSTATAKRRRGSANIRYAWYGTSKDGICTIVRHGFGQCEKPEHGEFYGFGLYLSPVGSLINSLASSIVDGTGLRHMLLCRVILGNMEGVCPGSEQFHPSSEEFDSGVVDNLFTPKKYIIWSTHMNTHILPQYIISYTVPPSLTGLRRIHNAVEKPTSAWMPFSTLISVISQFLPLSTVDLIKTDHSNYMENKITRQQLIQRVRQIAGDELLTAAIKSFRAKQHKAKVSSSSNDSTCSEAAGTN